MAYWLMKSEPAVYPWPQLVKDKKTDWSGVRNHQANKFMKTMTLDDEAFFYHSNEGREIVGIMKIIGLWRPDPGDETGTFGMVQVTPVRALPSPVALNRIKSLPSLADMVLLRQSRLSVSPVTTKEWEILCREGNV